MTGTIKIYRRWEFRKGDNSDLFIGNIDSATGIGTTGQIRDWLWYDIGVYIQKEWWEQNQYYVFRIQPYRLTYALCERRWGTEWYEVPCEEFYSHSPSIPTTSTTGAMSTKKNNSTTRATGSTKSFSTY